MTFLQFGLRFDEMCLERCPGLLLLRLGFSSSEVFLQLPFLRDEVVGDADDMPLCDGLARRGCVIDALIQPRVEDFEWIVEIEGFPDLPVVLCKVYRQYPRLVRVEVDE